ncbi:DeoR family transcriptional regulator, partial [Streptomyces torulosus]|uniref:DeoR family transcriptional regulator n=1 Tax=Streptomyces torulosus TaxID=68276 RepID=UPI000AC90591
MSRDARWQTLLELLVERGRLDVEEAAAELAVSAATIRRDFDQLAEQQMLVRTRGGAVVHGVSYELPLRYKTARRATEKQRVAKAVADLVAPGEAVGLTGGTTTTEVARAPPTPDRRVRPAPALTSV